MKKVIYTLLFSALTIAAVAQDEETTMAVDTKSSGGGNAILPGAGDLGVSFDAEPLFNLLSGTSANAYSPTGNLFIRYFLDEALAARVSFGYNQSLYSYEREVWTGDPNNLSDKVMDRYYNSNGTFNLGLGAEVRRGSGRVQGYYGGELGFIRSSGSQTLYEYGNAMTNDNPRPFTAITNQVGGSSDSQYNNADRTTYRGYSRRMLAQYRPSSTTITVRGVIGAEYFIAKKVSIGGELQWGYFNARTKDDNTGFEIWEEISPDGVRVEHQIKNNSSNSSKNYGFQNDFNSNIMLNLYF